MKNKQAETRMKTNGYSIYWNMFKGKQFCIAENNTTKERCSAKTLINLEKRVMQLNSNYNPNI
jgi:hypothetical protein